MGRTRYLGLSLSLTALLIVAGCAQLKSLTSQNREFRDCRECPVMVDIPAGTFQMGSPVDEMDRHADESPQHRVTIGSSFAMGRYEITRREYAQFVAATHKPDSPRCFADRSAGHSDFGWISGLSWRNPGYKQTLTDPAVCISWNDAQDYATWLSAKTGHHYRLPSEAEWEYAARAKGSPSRWWGDGNANSCAFANVADLTFATVYISSEHVACADGYVQTAPVGSFKPNPFGIYDLYGNAWEWVADCRNDDYVGAPSDGSAWMTGNCKQHVRRGGSWYRPPLRAAERSFLDGDGWHVNAGFRVVRDL